MIKDNVRLLTYKPLNIMVKLLSLLSNLAQNKIEMKSYSINNVLFFLLVVIIAFSSCQFNDVSSKTKVVADTTNSKENIPNKLLDVMNAHGGVDAWRSNRSLYFIMDTDGKSEKQFIDLWDRREKVENKEYSMGFDGNNYWTDADTSVKTNPIFYHNLIFYFYAMPFVLADPGIIYKEVDPLFFDGIAYPGFKISYKEGIGVSPEDEYFIHYDDTTKQMTWLGYTVTYYSKEKSKKIKWINYDDWQEVNGLKLPASMMWYISENSKPVKERSRKSFKHVKLRKSPFSDDDLAMTPNARIVTE